MTRPVAYITGASRGLGLRIAERLAPTHRLGLGYCTTLPSTVTVEDGKPVADGKPEVLALEGDVALPETSAQAVATLLRNFGRIDLFVANAAMIADRSLLRMTDEEWDRVLAVNLNGAFWGLRACAPALAESGGSAVLVASIMGRRGAAGAANYAAAKAGLMGLAVSAARELAPRVRVNVVCPGYLATDMGLAAPEAMEAATHDHLLGRLASVDDAARLVCEVAALEAVTGQVFAADGRIVPW